MKHHFLLWAALSLSLMACNSSSKRVLSMDTKVRIETSEGDIIIKLYDQTPKHRDNFIKIVKDGTLNGTLFHRVIDEFMIQGGDPDSKNATKGQRLGSGNLGYKVPAEFNIPTYFHKKGALAAAREGDQVNPEKASSSCQFYIVTGKVYENEDLDNMENSRNQQRMNEVFYQLANKKASEIMAFRLSGNQEALLDLQDSLFNEAQKIVEKEAPFTFTPQMRQAYTTIGGTPHLDGSYTVFGEVIEGLDVVDRIQKVTTDDNNRPLTDVVIKKVSILED